MDRVLLTHYLRVKIEMKLHHLLRDTKEFVDYLRHLQWQNGMRIVKMDIKEFYMLRKSGFLSHACSELFCDETVDFQLLHSGEVSDAGFWIAAERWLLTTSVRQWCSVLKKVQRCHPSRSQAIFLVSNAFSLGFALEQHSRVTSSWLRISVKIRSLSWLSMSWWSMAVL